MRAVVLCAGYATRLYPLTLDQPKALLPIGGRLLVNYLLDRLAQVRGLESVVVVTNQKFKKQFLAWKETLEFPKALDILADSSISDADKLGAIRDLELAISSLGIQEDLLVVAGDNLFDFDLSGFIEASLKARPALTIGLVQIEDSEEARRYGVVRVDSKNRVIEFHEKPDRPVSRLVSTGIYFLPEEKIAAIRNYLAGHENPDAPGHFFRWVSEREALYSYLFEGTWYDIGDRVTYEKANRTFRP